MSQTMVPVSGRIESDLYDWFIKLDYPAAKTNSDKLREALKELRQQREATGDYIQANAWVSQQFEPLRRALAVLERDHKTHSDVVAVTLDHVKALAALAFSARPTTPEQAAELEEQLVRRSMALMEALLRHAMTSRAAAFDPDIVRRHADRVTELVTLINQATKGDGSNG